MKRFRPRVPAERSTRTDRIAVAVITLIVVVLVLGVWVTSEARHSHLSTADGTPQAEDQLTSVPADLYQTWTHEISGPAPEGPVVSGPTVLATGEKKVEGLDPATGSVRWSYTRDQELCGVTASFSQFIPVFKGPAGCGEVSSLDDATGEYSHSRESANSSPVSMVRSNDNVGVVTPTRMELWRNDLVRTVEFGDVEDQAEPEMQPFPHCTIRSALTRSDLLAVLENCPDDKDSDGHAMLRLMKAVPDDSRKPEMIKSYNLGADTAQIVAISENKVAVYVAASEPRIDVVDKKGHVTSSQRVKPSPLIDAHTRANADAAEKGDTQNTFEPAINDGPHNMFWWDGERLYAFDPEDLSVQFVVADALGTGDVVGDNHLLVPVKGGISVVDTKKGEAGKTIPVERTSRGDAVSTGGDDSTAIADAVSLRVAGKTIVERQGNNLVGYRS